MVLTDLCEYRENKAVIRLTGKNCSRFQRVLTCPKIIEIRDEVTFLQFHLYVCILYIYIYTAFRLEVRAQLFAKL